ncbi:Mu transposase C-terminal domain-containing protein [Williamsia maris]|uniref:Mu transposase, C-terminal n=1 Tax=Williamsia maris TaxID=72806 RepID=A0ABT1HJL2_9NOCA|nr:Mu transposase C-terminal domain-containing protein [Williamsia maris]MCP2178119.1 Mu transposase, C-terminal [Williamsia maris]
MITLSCGDEVGLRSDRWQVSELEAGRVELQSFTDATTLSMTISELLTNDSFIAPAGSNNFPDQRQLDHMPQTRQREAEFWYELMHQVKYGSTPAEVGLIAATALTGTLEERLQKKRNELHNRGIEVSMSTMWRRYIGFAADGIVGCADKRGLPGHTRQKATDPLVHAILWDVMRSFTTKSTPSKKQVIELARTALSARNVVAPSRSTMYSIIDSLDRGEHTFGEAATRRSLANSPDRAFGKVRQLYPGQEVQLDSTPLDAFVLTADGRTERVDLALAIDVATRTICAAILRPRAARTVDAIELCTGAMRPMELRPGWSDAMSMARSYLPDEMLPEGELAEHVAARPIIDVRGVLVDRGKVFVSNHFLRVLESRQISHRIASPYDPTNKPIVERVFKTISEDFVRWIVGYKGRAVVHRGAHPETDAVWPLPLLQAMLDEWIVAVYQQRPTSGLRHNLMPMKALSPNAMYGALTASMPTTTQVLTHDEWISLQPCAWRTVQRYGINFQHLIYDSDELRFHDLRRTKSRHTTRSGQWEIRYDPGNLMTIWVRDDEEGQWIECRWVRAQHSPEPFGIDVLGSLLKLIDGQHEIDQQVLQTWRKICGQLREGPATEVRRSESTVKVAVAAAHREKTRNEMRHNETVDTDQAAPSTRPPEAVEQLFAVQPLSALRTTDDW